MYKKKIVGLVCFLTVALLAQNAPNFSGSWKFNPGKSSNIGMMAQVEMTNKIQQSSSSLDITSHSRFQGEERDTKTHYDLTGKPVTNESPMGGPAETVSKWAGGKLVTTWTSAGAVAGSKVVRTETRWLSPDGKVMTMESTRGNGPSMVQVFDKE
jgi:hypothetical protein